MERNVQVNTSTHSHEYVHQDIGRVKRFRPSLAHKNECGSPAKEKQNKVRKQNFEQSKINKEIFSEHI